MTDKSFKYSGIKVKVVVGFTMAIVTLLLAGAITYKSYRQLLSSVDVLSQPDPRLNHISNILTSLSEAESNIRAYTLTKEARYAKKYSRFVRYINESIDSLVAESKGNKLQKLKIDSIANLLNERVKSINAYSKAMENSLNDPTSKAISEINSSKDSATTTTFLKTTTTTNTTVDTLLVSEGYQDELKAKGLFNKIKNLLSKKGKKAESDSYELPIKTATSTEIVIDSSVVSQPDTAIIEDVKDLLLEIRKEEYKTQRRLARQELAMLKNNTSVIDGIKEIINELETEETQMLNQKKDEARVIVYHSIFTILLIIFICFLISLAFIILILNDVTNSNFYKEQLEKAKGKAEKLAKIKEQFLANMSHEIRTPLNAIIGFSEQLTTASSKKKQGEYINILQKSSGHLLSTVNDILDFSKIEAGKLVLEDTPFSISETILDVFQNLVGKAEAKNIMLIHNIDALDTPPLLVGDPFRFRQILFNLVENAIKFTDKGFVEIKCSLLPESEKVVKAHISVIDTGVGVAESKQNSIFKDFSQADSSSTRKYGGTGLGLSICKKLVDMYGGTINVKSEKDKGSTFAFSISYRRADISASTEPNSLSVIPMEVLKDKSILVVDDDQFNNLLIKIILQKGSAKVTVSKDGKEAMTKLKEGDYDLIITDIQMPEVSGLDLVRFVRSLDDETKSSIPVIALTANVMKQELETYLKAGMDDYLLKPFKEVDLYDKILQVLDMGKYQPPKEAVALLSNDFNIQSFEKYANGDRNDLVHLLQVFVKNANLDLKKLEKHVVNENWEDIREVVHRMITSYSHLEVDHVVCELEKLEAIKGDPQPIWGQINNSILKTISACSNVLAQVKFETEKLKNMSEA